MLRNYYWAKRPYLCSSISQNGEYTRNDAQNNALNDYYSFLNFKLVKSE